MRRLNWHNLVLAVLACFILFMPVEKRIWYDETVSMLIANGIGYTVGREADTVARMERTRIAQQNTLPNVFAATVEDNGNSLLYNVLLHYWILLFGHDLTVYVLLSRLFAVGALLMAARLAWLLQPSSVFVALTALLLTADPVFWGMAHEVRAYSLGIFLSLACGYYLFLILTAERARPLHQALFVAACLGLFFTHFLSFYLLLMFGWLILFRRPALLRSGPFLAALGVAGMILAIYVFIGIGGFEQIFSQNERIAQRQSNASFSTIQALLLASKHTAINFRVFLPYFLSAPWALAVSGLMALVLMMWGFKQAKDRFAAGSLILLGLSGTLGMTALSFISGHFTAFYFRYFSFCMPFAVLFVAWLAHGVLQNALKRPFRVAALGGAVLLPVLYVFFQIVLSGTSGGVCKYNHQLLTERIRPKTSYSIRIPSLSDAYLIHALSPASAVLDFERVEGIPAFEVLQESGQLVFRIPYVKNDE